MTSVSKMALFIAAPVAAVMLAPLLIVASLLPDHTSRSFYKSCAEFRGTRAAIIPDPPATPPTAEEVLLRISQTASTLGFGSKGAIVAAAISQRRTGLANAANPAVPDTQRYAHSVSIRSGAGALGLPTSWGTAAELMTPEVSTALLMDRMVNRIPNWRDVAAAEIAAELLGETPADYQGAAAAVHPRIRSMPAPTPSPDAPDFIPAAATHRLAAEHSPPPTATRAPLDRGQAAAAARDDPAAASCIHALSMVAPPPATGPDPRGPAVADAALAAIGSEPDHPAAATFVADIFAGQGRDLPDSVADLFALGWAAPRPARGDLVFTDISADRGPHLVGIAVTAETMVTVLPGRTTVQASPIGPNRIVRRMQVVEP